MYSIVKGLLAQANFSLLQMQDSQVAMVLVM